MSDNHLPNKHFEANAKLKQEIRENRKLTIEEWIMRLAGPDRLRRFVAP